MATNATWHFEVQFRIRPTPEGIGVVRRIRVDVEGSERGAHADAIIEASTILDDEGVKDWALIGCFPVLS